MIKVIGYRTIILVIVLLILSFFLYYILFQNVETNTEPIIDYVIGVSQPNLHEPWQVLMNEELHAEAAKHDNIRVIYADAAQSTGQQIEDIKTLSKYEIDLLIVSVEDSSALTPVISAIYQNIPVILLGRGVEGYNYTLYIGSDHNFIGEIAAEAAIDLLGDEGGQVIEVQGLASALQAEERSKGFREKIYEENKLEIIDSIAANWQSDKAEDELIGLLGQSNKQPDLIYAHNDAMALGSYRAIQSLGLEGIKIIGSDGVNKPKGGLQLVKEGIIDTTFITPTGGKQAFEYAIDILEKKSEIPKKIILGNHKVTKGNLEKYLNPKRILTEEYVKEDEVTLGFAQVGSESEWRSANTDSIISAAKKSDVNLIFKNAKNDQQKQIAIIREFIKQEVDVIAFSPKVEHGWEEILQEVRAAGIPVILSDREIKVSDSSLWTSFIGSDFVEEGRRAASWLVNEMDKPAPDKKVYIIELEGTKNSAPAVDRKQGFAEVLKDYPDYEIIDSLLGDFTLSKGKERMEQALEQYGEKIDVVYAHNDDMAIGAIEAIEDFGLQPGTDIKVISIDATIKAFNALSTGKLNYSVECNPLLGPQIMQAAQELYAGKEIPMKIITAEETFTQEEAKKEIKKRNY